MNIKVLTLMMAGALTLWGDILNLDATKIGQAQPFGNGPSIQLAAGTYTVTPVGKAGGGTFDAWSAFGSNSGCQTDHRCLYGWDTSFDYSYSAGYFSTDSGVRWDSPEEALAHAVSVTFTLTTTEWVSFGFNEKTTDVGDNRGGSSLSISAVPDKSSTAILLLIMCAAVAIATGLKRMRVV